MTVMKHWTLQLIALCLLPVNHLAAEPRDTPWALAVQWDNDLLTGTDDGYTNGSRVAFTRALKLDAPEHSLLQRFLRSLTGADRNNFFDDLRFDKSAVQNIQFGVGLSQLMFTPDNPNVPTPPAGERPYAGWLGAEFSLQAASEKSANTATLSIGTTGKNSYAEESQDWVHQNISDSPIFQGWDSQAPSELTINLHFDHKTRLSFLDDFKRPIEMDGFYEWGASLGNFRTDAYLGAFLRTGYNLPASYTTPRVQLGSFTDTIFGKNGAKQTDFSFYGFVGARTYAILHDIALDGPLFRDWAESVDSEPIVGEITFGVAAQWKCIELSLAHNLRSDEFDGQQNRSRYGSVLFRIGTQF